MIKKRSLFKHILIFTLAQVAWLSLLGLWIYWYVSNYIIFNKVGDRISPHIISEGTNNVPLIGGLILLVAVSVGMSIIFRNLNLQLKLTNLYDNFIANVTHELKSPLASIQLHLETMNERKISPDKINEFVNLMMKDTERLNGLINSILEISGLEQKKVAHNFYVYEADSVIRELIDGAVDQFALPKNAIKINGNVKCQCVMDKKALQMVFNNLIDNSIKYTTRPVNIQIELICLSKKFVIEFSDQGIGLSQKSQKKIFEKFHRIYNFKVPSVKGTGLGLYWVKEIIKHHGGCVSVFSEGMEKGSTFRIELPIYKTSKKRYINNLLKITQRRNKPTYIVEGIKNV
jgi:signal transduction histidine kinase